MSEHQPPQLVEAGHDYDDIYVDLGTPSITPFLHNPFGSYCTTHISTEGFIARRVAREDDRGELRRFPCPTAPRPCQVPPVRVGLQQPRARLFQIVGHPMRTASRGELGFSQVTMSTSPKGNEGNEGNDPPFEGR